MRHFPALLLLLRDVGELDRLAQALLGIGTLALGGNEAVVILDHGSNQPAGGDIEFGARHGFGRNRLLIFSLLSRREDIAMRGGPIVVDMRTVIGYEHG